MVAFAKRFVVAGLALVAAATPAMAYAPHRDTLHRAVASSDLNYAGVTTKPDFGGVSTKPDYAGVTTKPDFGGVSTKPDYAGVTTKPDFGGVSTKPDYAGVTTKPDFGNGVATSAQS